MRRLQTPPRDFTTPPTGGKPGGIHPNSANRISNIRSRIYILQNVINLWELPFQLILKREFLFRLFHSSKIIIAVLPEMKVLITGASGSIGGECLAQCLSHPDISTVVAFVRRNLPADVSNHTKLKCVLIEDFSQWPEDVLQAHADAAGMIWAMGSYKGSRTADLEYPLAFLEQMARVLETKPTRPRFRYIHLGGMFTRHDQEKKLWLLEYPRKIRGLGEAKALEFGDSNADRWKILVVRPGGVATDAMTGSRTVASILGDNWCVRIEELGAFMTYLAIDGEEESSVINNARIVRKGRELLKLR